MLDNNDNKPIHVVVTDVGNVAVSFGNTEDTRNSTPKASYPISGVMPSEGQASVYNSIPIKHLFMDKETARALLEELKTSLGVR